MIGDIIAFDPCDTCENHDMCSICELTLRRDGSLRTDKWISVDERLPDGNGSFLTVDEKGHMEVCYWEKRFGWFASSCNKNALTHWMPLPEAPKMKGGAE